MGKILQFLRSREGSSTVEFAAVVPFFFILVFFVMEVTLALFWWKSAEKATQLGARLAVVSDPVALGVPERIARAGGGVFGVRCSDGSAPCVDFGTLTCTGGGAGCDAAAFTRVATRMRQLFAPIEDQHIIVTYSYSGLGYAGGPSIPTVTVTLSGIPFQSGFVSILGNFIGGDEDPLITLPDISATLTGEDLSQSGA